MDGISRLRVWDKEIPHGVLPMEQPVLSDKRARNADLEWRLSFRTAELKLVRSWNDCQSFQDRTSFSSAVRKESRHSRLKLFVKEIIQPKFPDEDLLSSYIMKTVVFWLAEETHESLWKREHFIPCFRLCLGKLVSWLQRGFCPSYIIPEYNLFRTKLDRMFILGFREWLIRYIQEDDWRILLHCKTLKKRFAR